MLVTGYDPSTRNRWHAVTLAVDAQGNARIVATAIPGVGAHFVEVPGAVYMMAAARHLLDTAVTAGRLLEKTAGVGVSPEVWRQWLTGKRNPSDLEIKAALARHMRLPARSNEHQRDAMGLALYGASTLRSVASSLTQPANSASGSTTGDSPMGRTSAAKRPPRNGSRT